MSDYAEYFVRLKTDVPKLEEALNRRDWSRAILLSNEIAVNAALIEAWGRQYDT